MRKNTCLVFLVQKYHIFQFDRRDIKIEKSAINNIII